MSKTKFLKYLKEIKSTLKNKELDKSFKDIEQQVKNLKEVKQSSEGELKLPKNISGYALFSDGACRGNPGPGAWASIGQERDGELLFQCGAMSERTTNNQMELLGAINALKVLSQKVRNSKNSEVHLYSDSKYVVDGIEKWVPSWKQRGWKKADKKAPENLDLWMELDTISNQFSSLRFHWVKGHSGHPQNEFCDSLANQILDDNGY